MNDLLKKAYDPDWFMEEGHKLVQLLAYYLKTLQGKESMAVLPRTEPDNLARHYRDRLFEEKKDFHGLLREALALSNHLHHKGYVGHQVSVPALSGSLTQMLEGFLNNGSAVYEMGPVSTAMEKVVTETMCEAIGYGKQSGGIMTSGGSLGNLTAMLAALNIKTEHEIWSSGVKGKKPVFLFGENAHYCIARAVRILGLGEEGIRTVRAEKDHTMSLVDLEKQYTEIKNSGAEVTAVIANACSTATGAFDPLEKIADFCDKNKLWFHVDGAHGGAAIFSEKHRSKLSGLERADSVVIDFHKMLMTPSIITGLYFKNGRNAYESFEQEASYLWSAEGPEWYNSAKCTVECTKRMMALHVYALLYNYGTDLFEAYVDETFERAKEFADLINEADDFELANEPRANIVCFRYLKNDLDFHQLNALNRTIRRQILRSEKFYLVQTELMGTLFLRTSIMNPATRVEDLRVLMEQIRSYKPG